MSNATDLYDATQPLNLLNAGLNSLTAEDERQGDA